MPQANRFTHVSAGKTRTYFDRELFMLIGKYKYSADSKNRICIPQKFRANLGASCIFSKDLTLNCLNLYSVAQFEKYCAKIEELPLTEAEDMRIFTYSNSDGADIDSQGRIVLNQQLCADIGLAGQKEAVIVGVFTHAQIWSVPEWEAFSSGLNAADKREAIKNELRKIRF
jgi:MraZ protein